MTEDFFSHKVVDYLLAWSVPPADFIKCVWKSQNAVMLGWTLTLESNTSLSYSRWCTDTMQIKQK